MRALCGAEPDTGMPVLEPVLTYSVTATDGTDVHTLLSKLRILEAEDPMLNAVWNEVGGEIRIRLMGDI